MQGNRHGYLLVLAAAAGWSTSGMFIRWTVASSGLSALALAFWRDLATFLLLLACLRLIRPHWLRVERRDLPWLAALGALGVGTFHVLWNLAILQIGYAIATILLYSSPAFVTLMAWLIWREPLSRLKILAIVLALAGCVLVAGREELASVEMTAGGLILGLAAAVFYGSFSLFGRQVAARYSPWTVLTYGFGFGALALLPLQFKGVPPLPTVPAGWIWFTSLVVVATILPFGAYLAGLGRLPVSVASILAASEVVFGSAIGYVVFGEQMTVLQMVGGGLVVAGVALLVYKGQTREGRAARSASSLS